MRLPHKGKAVLPKEKSYQAMTQGPVAGQLFGFAMPLFFSMLFQQFYNLADTVVAGRFISASALSAIGIISSVNWIYLALTNGTGQGCNVVIARIFGSGDREHTHTAITTALIFQSSLALVLTAIFLPAHGAILRLINTPDSLYRDASTYLIIYTCALLFQFLYTTANSCFQALGDSRMCLLFLIFSSLTNIGLDIVFVVVFSLGVAGIAWATFLTQGMAALLSCGMLLRRLRRLVPSSQKPPLFDGHILRSMLGVMLPYVCQQSFVSVGIMMVQGLVNTMGEIAIMSFTVGNKISGFCIACMGTFARSFGTFSSQNYGAGAYSRIREGLRVTVKFQLIACTVVAAAYYFLSPYVIGLFLADDAPREALTLGFHMLMILAAGNYALEMKNSFDNALIGCGQMSKFMITTFTDLFVRVGLSYALAAWLGFYALPAATIAGWLVGGILAFVFYQRFKRAYLI
ncbi:MAG: MATE family efflux transporter [Butyricicoccus sp.]|nr:MATE family efflux transporter [Butyricicoccus sp.]